MMNENVQKWKYLHIALSHIFPETFSSYNASNHYFKTKRQETYT